MTGFSHIHSSFRYLVLFFLIAAVVDAFMAISSGSEYSKRSKLFALGTLVLTHIQALVGLVLYFMGSRGAFQALMNDAGAVMGNSTMRFFSVEHALMMIVAVTLITMGYSKSKKAEGIKKYKTIRVFYTIALIIIFIMIPWPFMKDFGTWF